MYLLSNVKKAVMVILLAVFVGISVWLSFNTISRPTFEYEQQTDIGGTGKSGWVLSGYNGNANVSDVRIYHPMIKNENKTDENSAPYIEDTSRVISGIDKFTFVSDENMVICRIGPDVSYIDEQAFFGCFALKAVIVDKNNKWYTDIDGVLFTKDKTEMVVYPAHHAEYLEETGKVEKGFYTEKENPETYEVPEGVKKISSMCFYKVYGIQKITFPSTLEEIGDMAFFKCDKLELVSLPESIKQLGNDSFSYCTNMRFAVYIPGSMEEIGHHCFYKCDNIEKFYLAAKNEDDIILGGRWQPKEENKFKSTPPVFGASKKDCDDYNAARTAETKGA